MPLKHINEWIRRGAIDILWLGLKGREQETGGSELNNTCL